MDRQQGENGEKGEKLQHQSEALEQQINKKRIARVASKWETAGRWVHDRVIQARDIFRDREEETQRHTHRYIYTV